MDVDFRDLESLRGLEKLVEVVVFGVNSAIGDEAEEVETPVGRLRMREGGFDVGDGRELGFFDVVVNADNLVIREER